MRRRLSMITTVSSKKNRLAGDHAVLNDILDTIHTLVDMFLDWLEVTLPAMMLAVFGATVRAIRDNAEHWLWKDYFAGIVLAMFVGYVVDCILGSTGISIRARGPAIAVSGFLSGEVLRAIKRIYEKRIIFIIGGDPNEKSDSEKSDK